MLSTPARPTPHFTLDPPFQGGTYGGSALGCAAAAATIDVIEEEGLLQVGRAQTVRSHAPACIWSGWEEALLQAVRQREASTSAPNGQLCKQPTPFRHRASLIQSGARPPLALLNAAERGQQLTEGLLRLAQVGHCACGLSMSPDEAPL